MTVERALLAVVSATLKMLVICVLALLLQNGQSGAAACPSQPNVLCPAVLRDRPQSSPTFQQQLGDIALSTSQPGNHLLQLDRR